MDFDDEINDEEYDPQKDAFYPDVHSSFFAELDKKNRQEYYEKYVLGETNNGKWNYY